MKLYLTVGKNGRVGGVNPPDVELLRRLPVGTGFVVDVSRPRNIALHRKFFALCQFIVDNHPRFDSVEQVVRELKIRAHHYDEHITLDGEIVYVPRSISFGECDEDVFRAFYERAVLVTYTSLLPSLPAPALTAYLEEAASFA